MRDICKLAVIHDAALRCRAVTRWSARTKPENMTQQITIIGVGLIGGSFALALREAGADVKLVGTGRSEANLRRAVERGIIDTWSTSLPDAVAGSDVVLMATPVGATNRIMQQMVPALSAGTIVTDAGSVKQSIIDSARQHMSHFSNFVPAHPIAGTEHSGVEAGFASLYRGKRLILTPVKETSDAAIETVAGLWETTGAVLETMEPSHHDAVFAATSHLPHLLAFSLVETLYRMDQESPLLHHTGGGFADYTRIASSDPVMWRDVCLNNRDALLNALDVFNHGLEHLAGAIEAGDGEILEQLFTTAKITRDTKVLPAEQRKAPGAVE